MATAQSSGTPATASPITDTTIHTIVTAYRAAQGSFTLPYEHIDNTEDATSSGTPFNDASALNTALAEAGLGRWQSATQEITAALSAAPAAAAILQSFARDISRAIPAVTWQDCFYDLRLLTARCYLAGTVAQASLDPAGPHRLRNAIPALNVALWTWLNKERAEQKHGDTIISTTVELAFAPEYKLAATTFFYDLDTHQREAPETATRGGTALLLDLMARCYAAGCLTHLSSSSAFLVSA